MDQNYTKRNYTVEPYNPAWASLFQTEASIIKKVLVNLASRIEHVGSTAVPGLAGKPTIDLLVIVEKIEPVKKAAQLLIDAGYNNLGEYVRPGALLFTKEKDQERLVNVHIFTADDPHTVKMLALRDFLREHPQTTKEYNDLKLKLYQKYPNDYEQYRKHKDAWMDDLKKRILKP